MAFFFAGYECADPSVKVPCGPGSLVSMIFYPNIVRNDTVCVLQSMINIHN